MKSKKHLFERLERHFGVAGVQLGTYSISDETYGRKSMIYFSSIRHIWGVSRRDFENLLESWGFKVNRSYYPEADAVEVQVSYFRGYHWDV